MYVEQRRSGYTERTYRLDGATAARLEYVAHVLRHACGCAPGIARGSAIFRRALAMYAEHVSTLVVEQGDPNSSEKARDAYLRRRGEVARLRAAAEGSSLGVSTALLLTDPVRPLGEILAEHQKQQPAPLRKPLLGLPEDGENDDEANDSEHADI